MGNMSRMFRLILELQIYIYFSLPLDASPCKEIYLYILEDFFQACKLDRLIVMKDDKFKHCLA